MPPSGIRLLHHGNAKSCRERPQNRFFLTRTSDHGKLLEPLNNGLLTMLRSPQFDRPNSIPAGMAELLVSISSQSIAMYVQEDHKP
jgi:hypothetical protein